MDLPKDAPKPEPPRPAPESAALVPAVLTSQTAHNAIRLIGEAILPGASLLMDGKIVQGGLHLLAGAVARVALGPIGYVAVIANSYSSSTTGKNLLQQFSRFVPAKTP